MKDIAKQPKRVKPLPPAGPEKRDPKEREKMLDKGLEDSMATSDPVSTTMPEVKRDREPQP
jgi:hypothetical protein